MHCSRTPFPPLPAQTTPFVWFLDEQSVSPSRAPCRDELIKRRSIAIVDGLKFAASSCEHEAFKRVGAMARVCCSPRCVGKPLG